jgi:copper(I)-binding protein
MRCFRLHLCVALVAGILFAPAVRADGVMVRDAWARASAGNAITGAAYLSVTGGEAPEQLVSVSAPVAATAEVHESFTEGGVMKMRRAPSVAIPAGKTVTFAPGGYHIMLMGLKQPLIGGQSFPLTVSFAHAAPVTVEVKVQALGRASPSGGHDEMPMH